MGEILQGNEELSHRKQNGPEGQNKVDVDIASFYLQPKYVRKPGRSTNE